MVTSETATSSPPYMQALLLSSEDTTNDHEDPTQSDSDPLHSSQESSEQAEASNTGDSYENPFLKPAKRVKITLLASGPSQ